MLVYAPSLEFKFEILDDPVVEVRPTDKFFIGPEKSHREMVTSLFQSRSFHISGCSSLESVQLRLGTQLIAIAINCNFLIAIMIGIAKIPLID